MESIPSALHLGGMDIGGDIADENDYCQGHV
jgi:hypothetical protein